MLVPFLEDGSFSSGQSMAILEYLEEAYPTPELLPESQQECADVRSFCNSICCDIHPLNNLRVQLYLRQNLAADDKAMHAWMSHWMYEGFRSAELTAQAHDGPFVFGESVTLADACLVPQLYNAHRFDIALDDFPTLVAVEAHCLSLPGFADAVPRESARRRLEGPETRPATLPLQTARHRARPAYTRHAAFNNLRHLSMRTPFVG